MVVGVGPAKVYLDNLAGAASGTLSFNLDLESIFSGSHRKVHGLSGNKNTQRQARALKTAYDRLWAHYRARGWIR